MTPSAVDNSLTVVGMYARGPATNAASTFRHLGGKAALVTSIGQHPLTALIRDELSTHDVKAFELSPDRSDRRQRGRNASNHRTLFPAETRTSIRV